MRRTMSSESDHNKFKTDYREYSARSRTAHEQHREKKYALVNLDPESAHEPVSRIRNQSFDTRALPDQEPETL